MILEPYKLLQPYTVDLFKLKDHKWKIIEFDPKLLIAPHRIDLAAKLLYIDHYVRGFDMTYAADVYARHIEAFNHRMTEPGQPEKNSLSKFFAVFNNLIDEIRKNGFDSDISLIPLAKDNIMLDGAHRVSCAIYFNKTIKAIQFPELYCDWNINHQYFRDNLLLESSLDAMALEYCKWKNNLYILCLWPRATGKEERAEAERLIKKHAVVVHSKNVPLSFHGMHNLMCQIYGSFDWVGTVESLFDGVNSKADACYGKGGMTSFYLLESSDFEKIKKLKTEIRDLFRVEKHSVHITDTFEETCQIAQAIFNINSLHHLERGFPFRYKASYVRLSKFREAVLKKRMHLDDFIIDASQVMASYGIREARDLDYLSLHADIQDQLMDVLTGIDAEDHSPFLRYHNVSKEELIKNPMNYFVFNGIKLISLKKLKEFKLNKGESKDIADVRLIDVYLRNDLFLLKFKWLSFINALKRHSRRHAPTLRRTLSLRFIVISLTKYIGIYEQARKVYRATNSNILHFMGKKQK